ncbi:hypothetical protein [Maribacter sp. Hel_I_7]|uniref:hypothetical protein n=1 Tax=Maribacter sp. Hel_I_7 TaxID=1249997 RepID=UPI000AB6E638|nr:hypothetical protein [Maribacter sp. Hel_I_7]
MDLDILKLTVLNRIGSTEIIVNTLEFSDYAYFSKFFKSKMGMTPLWNLEKRIFTKITT